MRKQQSTHSTGCKNIERQRRKSKRALKQEFLEGEQRWLRTNKKLLDVLDEVYKTQKDRKWKNATRVVTRKTISAMRETRQRIDKLLERKR